MAAPTEDRDATPDEVRALLAELHRVTSAPAPLEDCPFALTPPAPPKPRRAKQSNLFE